MTKSGQSMQVHFCPPKGDFAFDGWRGAIFCEWLTLASYENGGRGSAVMTAFSPREQARSIREIN